MSVKPFLRAASALTLSFAALSVQAAPFSFQYTDTVSSSGVSGVSAGDASKTIVTLDNGGSSLNSQMWTVADLQSVVLDFGNGALHITFNTPLLPDGLDTADGVFATDASGLLIFVPTLWFDYQNIGNFTTNGAINPRLWGFGSFVSYSDVNYQYIDSSNSPSSEAASSWSLLPPSSVPVPATLWLVLSGLAGFGAFSKRRAA